MPARGLYEEAGEAAAARCQQRKAAPRPACIRAAACIYAAACLACRVAALTPANVKAEDTLQAPERSPCRPCPSFLLCSWPA